MPDSLSIPGIIYLLPFTLQLCTLSILRTKIMISRHVCSPIIQTYLFFSLAPYTAIIPLLLFSRLPLLPPDNLPISLATPTVIIPLPYRSLTPSTTTLTAPHKSCLSSSSHFSFTLFLYHQFTLTHTTSLLPHTFPSFSQSHPNSLSLKTSFHSLSLTKSLLFHAFSFLPLIRQFLSH